MTSKYLKLMFFVAITMLAFPGCKKTENPGLENSGLLVLGDQKDVKLVTIVPYPDGGFVVGAETRLHQNQEIWILKYDKNFDLQWQRTLGGSMSNKLLRIFIGRENKIFVGGMAYGFGQDTFPLNLHKFWIPYFHLLNEMGNTEWETNASATSAGLGSGIEERISDIIQDVGGNYVIGGEFSPPFHSHMYKIKKDGSSIGSFYFNNDNSGKIDAIFETGNSYSVFNYWDSGGIYKPKARVFQIAQSDTGGADLYYSEKDLDWPWPSKYLNGSFAGLKLNMDNGLFTFNYIFQTKVYRYTYDPNTTLLSGKYLQTGLDQLIAASTTFDGHFIFTRMGGTIYETDPDFSVLNQFKTKWNVKSLCKLYNNEYVLGTEQGKSIYLIHFNHEGKIMDHE